MRRRVPEEDTGKLVRELFLDRTGKKSRLARAWTRGLLSAWSAVLPRRVPPVWLIRVLLAPAVLLDMLVASPPRARWVRSVLAITAVLVLLTWFDMWVNWGTAVALVLIASGAVMAWRNP